jgi:hypothetical protein
VSDLQLKLEASARYEVVLLLDFVEERRFIP